MKQEIPARPEDSARKAVTIYDISRLSGVSPATVSRVLNGSANVSPRKQAAVLAAVEASGFRPNVLAQSLAGSQTHTIGFVVPDIKNPYYSSIYYHVELLASQSGYSVLLANSRSDYENESKILGALTGRRTDAILFMGGRIDLMPCRDEGLRELERANQLSPLLLTSRVESTFLPQLCTEESGAIRALMQHLRQQGCRTFAVLGGCEEARITHLRRRMMIHFGREFGMETRPEWIFNNTEFSIEGGQAAAAAMMAAGPLPDAACCLNDTIAAGALNQIAAQGIQVPHDLLLTGFDGEYLCEIVRPGITTVEFDYPDFARQIFDLLLRLIHHESCPAVSEIYPHLTVRGSTQR